MQNSLPLRRKTDFILLNLLQHVWPTPGGDQEFSGAKLDMYGIADETTGLHRVPCSREGEEALPHT